MRPLILTICLLIGATTAAIAAGGTTPDRASIAATAQKQTTIRLAQNRNRHRNDRHGRGSVVEGCGVRDALCVADRLLHQMARDVGGRRRARIEDLEHHLQRDCGNRPKDAVCAGEFVSRGLRIMAGHDNTPAPVVRERRRGGPPVVPEQWQRPGTQAGGRPVAGLKCVQARGYPGLFPARISDNRRFGSQGFVPARGPRSCAFAIRNWNRQFNIACTNHSSGSVKRFLPQNVRDAYGYGIGMPTLQACVEVVNGIRNGAICTIHRGSPGLRIMDIATRRVRGPSFLSVDRCLAALDRPRR